MVHNRHSAFTDLADRLRPSMPYLTSGRWDDPPGISGRNRIPLNRLFVPLRNGVERSVIRNYSLPDKPSHELLVGQAYLIPSGIDLAFSFAANSDLIAIHFALEPVPGLDLFRHLHGCQHLLLPPWLIAAFSDERDRADTIGQILRLRGLMEVALAPFLETNADDFRRTLALEGRWSSLLQLVDDDLGADLRIATIAAHLGLSTNALSKRFRRDFGSPLKDWLTDRLTARAATLLTNGGLRVHQVADQLRFSSEFHFSRFFKRCTGLSPTFYRDKLDTTKSEQ